MKISRVIPIVVATAFVAAVPVRWSLAQVPGLDIHYVPTSTEAVDVMLKMAKVTGSDVVYDLGSGDGRIPIAAAQVYGARGVGVELDPKLVRLANDNARKAGVTDKVTFIQADLFKTDLSKATVVTLYLSPSVNLRLRSKLQRELAPGSRVVSNRFPIPDWPPEQQLKVGDQDVFLYTIKER
jgi:SAM-dependent methyltransferase